MVELARKILAVRRLLETPCDYNIILFRLYDVGDCRR